MTCICLFVKTQVWPVKTINLLHKLRFYSRLRRGEKLISEQPHHNADHVICASALQVPAGSRCGAHSHCMYFFLAGPIDRQFVNQRHHLGIFN